MDTIQDDLQRAVEFIRSSKSLDSTRNQLIEQLTRDLLQLDETKATPERREMIYAIQNVISQLEHLYDKEKPPILLKSPRDELSSSRLDYLPEGRHSHYALGNSFTDGSL